MSKTREVSPRVAACTVELRRLLADGPAPASKVAHRLQSLFGPEVVGHARRRLGVVTTRRADGAALYALPDEDAAA